MTVDLAVRTGLGVAIPLFLIGLYNITPQLPSIRRRGLAIYVLSVLSLYAAGLWFVYYIMYPRGVAFLLSYGTDVAVPLITLSSIFALLKTLFLVVPLAFEMPLFMWLLARARIVTYKRVRKIRKIVPLGLAIFTAFITPTVDYYNFFIMYIPMLVLFEAGMFLMWRVNPEQGNYMWFKTAGRVLRKIGNVIMTLLLPVRLPLRGLRWVYRRVRR